MCCTIPSILHGMCFLSSLLDALLCHYACLPSSMPIPSSFLYHAGESWRLPIHPATGRTGGNDNNAIFRAAATGVRKAWRRVGGGHARRRQRNHGVTVSGDVTLSTNACRLPWTKAADTFKRHHRHLRWFYWARRRGNTTLSGCDAAACVIHRTCMTARLRLPGIPSCLPAPPTLRATARGRSMPQYGVELPFLFLLLGGRKVAAGLHHRQHPLTTLSAYPHEQNRAAPATVW